MDDLIRASALTINEEDVSEEDFDEIADSEKIVGDEDEEGMDMSSWEN